METAVQEEEKDSNDVKNEVKLAKRPISLTLVVFVGAGFLLYLLLTIFPLKNFSISSMLMPFLVFMPLSFIISLILFRSNRKKNQKRAKSFAIVSGASVVLFFLVFTLIKIFLENIEADNSYFNDKRYEKAIVLNLQNVF